MHRSRRRRRFQSVLLGTFVLSLAVVVAACVLTTSPRQVAAQRRPPTLPPATAEVRSGPEGLEAPVLAIFDRDGTTTVRPADGRPALPVAVGPPLDGWVRVTGEGLMTGDTLVLRPYDDLGMTP